MKANRSTVRHTRERLARQLVVLVLALFISLSLVVPVSADTSAPRAPRPSQKPAPEIGLFGFVWSP